MKINREIRFIIFCWTLARETLTSLRNKYNFEADGIIFPHSRMHCSYELIDKNEYLNLVRLIVNKIFSIFKSV